VPKANLLRLLNIADRYGTTPLDHLMSVVADETASSEERRLAATAAAPFVHPKLRQVELSFDMPRTEREVEAEIIGLLTAHPELIAGAETAAALPAPPPRKDLIGKLD
jgi:hypothetical protein